MSSTSICQAAKSCLTPWEIVMKNNRLSDQVGPVSAHSSGKICAKVYLKQSLFLAISIFFVAAPAPDKSDIADITANFIAPVNLAEIFSSRAGK